MAKDQPAVEDIEDGGDIEIGPGGSAARRTEGGFSFHFTFDLPKLPSLNTHRDWSHQALINAGLLAGLAVILLYLAFDRLTTGGAAAPVREPEAAPASPLASNLLTDFNPNLDSPVADGAYVDASARVTGHVEISKGVYVGRFATVSSDVGQPMHIGANSNVQDLATIGARPTFVYGKLDPAAFAEVPERSGEFAVYIGDEVSIGSQAQVFGPVFVGNGTYIGMQALIVNATVGAGVVIEPGAIVMGVSVPDGRYVPAGEVVTTQHAADALPSITEKYAFRRLGADTVDLYLALAVSLGATAEVAQESESPSSSTSSGDGHSATGAAPPGEEPAATPEDAHASSGAHD